LRVLILKSTVVAVLRSDACMLRPWLICLFLTCPAWTQASVPDEAQVLHVPDGMRTLLQTEVIDKTRYPAQRLRRLVDFMFEPWGLGLVYEDSYSRTIEQGFHDRRGNCLTFTLTFVELARLAGLDARMQEAEIGRISTPDDRTLVYTGHVNVAVKLGRQSRSVDFDRTRALYSGNYDPLPKQRALAHYYNNRGVELMTAADLGPADAYFDRAIRLDPSMAQAHGNRGVLQLRLGNAARALRHLHAALVLDPEDVSTLANLIAVQRDLGNLAKAADYRQQLLRLHGSDPYRFFVIGLQLQQLGQHSQALSWFEKAARSDRRQPLFLFGMVRSLQALGQPDQARQKEARALALNRRLSIEDQRIISPAAAAVTGLTFW
jgi:Tfp pilus assembly protein PilF